MEIECRRQIAEDLSPATLPRHFRRSVRTEARYLREIILCISVSLTREYIPLLTPSLITAAGNDNSDNTDVGLL